MPRTHTDSLTAAPISFETTEHAVEKCRFEIDVETAGCERRAADFARSVADDAWRHALEPAAARLESLSLVDDVIDVERLVVGVADVQSVFSISTDADARALCRALDRPLLAAVRDLPSTGRAHDVKRT